MIAANRTQLSPAAASASKATGRERNAMQLTSFTWMGDWRALGAANEDRP
jgi:hypothetical protein